MVGADAGVAAGHGASADFCMPSTSGAQAVNNQLRTVILSCPQTELSFSLTLLQLRQLYDELIFSNNCLIWLKNMWRHTLYAYKKFGALIDHLALCAPPKSPYKNSMPNGQVDLRKANFSFFLPPPSARPFTFSTFICPVAYKFVLCLVCG